MIAVYRKDRQTHIVIGVVKIDPPESRIKSSLLLIISQKVQKVGRLDIHSGRSKCGPCLSLFAE